MLSKDFLRSRRREELSDEEKAAIENMIDRVITVSPRQTVIRRGEPVQNSTLLLSGFMSRYMDARDGYRQLVAYQVPGDFVDLHGYPLRRLDHDVGTLTEVTLALVPHARITETIEKYPKLGRLLWFSTLLDAAMHREWIFRLGRLGALGRVAHFLCETHTRMAAVGRVTDGVFEFPMTQGDLGEACGLTNVHVNRVLRRLREGGLVEISQRHARILDQTGLARAGEFNPDYLYCDGDEWPETT